MSNELAFVYDIFIGAPVTQVWKGIVDGDMTRHYVYGTRLESKHKNETAYAYVAEGAFKVVDGEILEIEAEKRLIMSWKAHWDETVSKDRASRVTHELSPVGPSTTKLLHHPR